MCYQWQKNLYASFNKSDIDEIFICQIFLNENRFKIKILISDTIDSYYYLNVNLNIMPKINKVI